MEERPQVMQNFHPASSSLLHAAQRRASTFCPQLGQKCAARPSGRVWPQCVHSGPPGPADPADPADPAARGRTGAAAKSASALANALSSLSG